VQRDRNPPGHDHRGEPFVRKDLMELFEAHGETLFQVYTNGTLVDERMIDRFVALVMSL